MGAADRLFALDQKTGKKRCGRWNSARTSPKLRQYVAIPPLLLSRPRVRQASRAAMAVCAAA